MKRILIPFGEAQKLGSLFQVSQPTIRRALRGKVDTDLSRKIRKAAIERGGVETNQNSNVTEYMSEDSEFDLLSKYVDATQNVFSEDPQLVGVAQDTNQGFGTLTRVPYPDSSLADVRQYLSEELTEPQSTMFEDTLLAILGNQLSILPGFQMVGVVYNAKKKSFEFCISGVVSESDAQRLAELVLGFSHDQL